MNPNAAADPGLVYDMGSADYLRYLCAVGYNNSVISRLRGQSTMCPIQRLSVLDVNLPSITIPNLKSPINLTRTVTNVGPINSVYRAIIEPPVGTVVLVKPDVLAFSSGTKTISFTVIVSSVHQMNTGYLFGSLTWTNGVHAVRSPISVRTEFLKSYADES